MVNVAAKFINKFEINTFNKSRDDKFYASLRQLVTILFAIVFGVGLAALKGKDLTDYNLWVLVLAYTAILFSWWGYHWGTVMGPYETNWLSYVVDVLLLVIYWYLINTPSPLAHVIFWYVLMFLLYYFWEAIRCCKTEGIDGDQKQKIRKARKANLLFFVILTLLLFCDFNKSDLKQLIAPTLSWLEWRWMVVSILFLLVVGYRWVIHAIYYPAKETPIQNGEVSAVSDEILIKRAKDAARYAKAHLSNYRVGVAILSDKGNVYTGCNIEFDNYSNTIHAEEAALSALISAGEDTPVRVAVFTSGDKFSFPCGMCRQSLFEIGGADLKVIACTETESKVMSMGELLPEGFKL